MIGILPTVTENHLNGEALSANPRYALLNEQIFAARGEDLHIQIEGVERLSTYADTIAPEAACTSVQFHLQVAPSSFARAWNAAQAMAGVQVAVGANSPFFFGKELWRETRIALFEQATDTRPEELKAQGVRPRVWFGERWITSIFDLFEENVRFFPALLPICETEDPVEVLERGDTPELFELRLHNGTIYRWNRPIYDVVRGRPHLRVENRITPAGRRWPTSWPTALSTTASPATWRRKTDRCGHSCRSPPPGRTSTKARSMALTPMCTGRGSAPFPSANWCYDGYCRSRTRDSSAGMWRLRSATGFSASSSSAASPARTVRPGSQRCSTSCTTIGTSIDMRRCAR